MLAAGEGDAFSTTTPETASDDVTELVAYAGDAFDPARWLLVSDAAGPVGVVLPQPYPDEPGTGSLFYIGVMPDRRGAGHGARLHLLGLHELAARGCTRYVGSTDERPGRSRSTRPPEGGPGRARRPGPRRGSGCRRG